MKEVQEAAIVPLNPLENITDLLEERVQLTPNFRCLLFLPNTETGRQCLL